MKIKVTALENGPYLVPTGGKYTYNGEEKEGKQVALCRCGHSKNKPFCDGAHKDAGLIAPAAEIEIEVE